MSKKKATAISLPISRTARIMNSAVGVESVNPDIVALATKATELFLMDFARRAYDQSSADEEFQSSSLEYDDIQKLVHSDPRYDFLMDSIPKRMKFSEALELVNKKLKEEDLNKALKASQSINETGNTEDGTGNKDDQPQGEDSNQVTSAPT